MTKLGWLLFLTGQLAAQAAMETQVLKTWEQTFGGSADEGIAAILPANDGGFLVGGASESPPGGNKTAAHYGDRDFWIVKIDRHGNKQWDQSYGGSGQDWCNGIQPTSDGGYLLTGYSDSPASGNKSAAGFGLLDGWVVRIDGDGNKLWDRSFGGTGVDALYVSEPTGDGGLLVSGYSGSPVSGNKTAPDYGNRDYWIVKIDSEGNKEWEQSYGGSGQDDGVFLQPAGDGGYLLVGYSSSFADGNRESDNIGGRDGWVVKIDGDGTKLWDRAFGGSESDELLTAVLASQGGFLLAGHSYSPPSGNKTAENFGATDYWVVRIDANGTKLWDQSFGGTGSEEVRSLQATADGGFLLNGHSSSPINGNKTSPNFGSNDIWLVKIDEEGVKQWEQTFGGTSFETAYLYDWPEQPDSDVGLLIGGGSGSPPSSNKLAPNLGGSDYWAINLHIREVPAGTPVVLVNNLFNSENSFTVGNVAQVTLQTLFTDGTIRYTLDGSAPTVSSTLYTGPFDLIRTSTLRTIAFSSNGAQSALGDPVSILAAGDYFFGNFAGQPGGAGNTDGAGPEARFHFPNGVAATADGTVYVADTGNYTIRKITAGGVVTTFAGSAGQEGLVDGTGHDARFGSPRGLTVDGQGNLFVADSSMIRKITPGGVVTGFAGSAMASGSSDGTGSEARFLEVRNLAFDASGNLYVSDGGNHTIRKITAEGVVTTLAGSPGLTGSADGTGGAARFNGPRGVGVDAFGNVYVADNSSHAIRKITPQGTVTTFAGSAGLNGNADGIGSAARFNFPSGLTVDSAGHVYVGDGENNTIRKITPAGVVSTIVGSKTAGRGSADGVGIAARLSDATGLALDGAGNLYAADRSFSSIRKITPKAVVTTLAGVPTGAGHQEGTGSDAKLNFPRGIALDAQGNVYVADTANVVIRKITPAGLVSTLTGKPQVHGSVDGFGTSARFVGPQSVALDASGNVYVAEDNAVRKVTPAGDVTTIAGAHGQPGHVDATGTAARFHNLKGVAADASGTLYLADQSNGAVRKMTAGGVVTTLASGLTGPVGVALDASGNVFVATSGHSVLRITPSGVVTTFAGRPGNAGDDDGPASTARFHSPQGLAVDGAGNVFVADEGNHTIRKISTDGLVTTIGGSPGLASDLDAIGLDARFSSPSGIALDSTGNLYIADRMNNRISKGTAFLSDGEPRILSSPQSQTVVPGMTLALEAVTGGAALSFQWRRNGVPVETQGANTSRLVFNDVQVADAGTYDLVIANIYGSAVSSAVGLVVRAPLFLSQTGTGTVAKSPDKALYDFGANETVTLTATPGTYYAFSQWSDGLTTNPRTLTLDAVNSFTAIFTPTVPLETQVLKVWDKTYGGSLHDRVEGGIQPAGGGGYLLAGSSQSGISGNKKAATHGASDFWVVKIDEEGNKVWDKSYGGDAGDSLQAIRPTGDGGYLIGGASSSGASGNKSTGSHGENDYWVVKIDSNGAKIWDRTFGGTLTDDLYDIMPTGDGGFLLGGLSNSEASGNKSAAPWGDYDYWVVKIDAEGNKIWDKTYGGSSVDSLLAIQPTEDGGFLLGGWSASGVSGNKSAASHGSGDYWLVKIDADGHQLWDRSYGGLDNDNMSSLQSAGGGGFFLGGYSNSSVSGNKTAAQQGEYDFWVIKIDDQGTPVGIKPSEAPRMILTGSSCTRSRTEASWSVERPPQGPVATKPPLRGAGAITGF